MSRSLRDQLLQAGFRPAPVAEVRKRVRRGPPAHELPACAEPSLAQAYALRAKMERQEREAAQHAAREKAAAKRERKRRVREILAGQALNRADAERPRHFEFAGKIRRVYVTPDQLRELNTGGLGVVMHGGRATLVARAVAVQAQAAAPELVALLIDPEAPLEGDDGVPMDLTW